jgi:hypothetical protein
MEYVRQTVETARLGGVFDLPLSLRGYSRLEVTIRPAVGSSPAKKSRAARDTAIINRNAARFNREAEENLLFQAPL